MKKLKSKMKLFFIDSYKTYTTFTPFSTQSKKSNNNKDYKIL